MINPSWITAEFVKTLSVMANNIFFYVEKNMGLVHGQELCKVISIPQVIYRSCVVEYGPKWTNPSWSKFNQTSFLQL